MTIHLSGKGPKGILIYGAGNVGQTVARLAAGYGWPVTLVNRAGNKVGKDAGVLTDCPALEGCMIGDAELTDLQSVWADVAIIAINDRLEFNLPYHRKLLEAGLNVICVGAESSYPKAVDKKYVDELDRIAKANGVTFTGCGLWDTYRIWSVRTLVGPCTRLYNLRHSSVTNANNFGADVVNLVHIGENPSDIDLSNGATPSIYRVFAVQTVEALGLRICAVDEHQEPVTLDTPVRCDALDKDIPSGKCVGIRTVVTVKTDEGVTTRAEIDLRLIKEDESEGMKWIIDGEPPVEMRLTGLDTGHATSSSVVNRVPYVLQAPPGLITTNQMSPMISHCFASMQAENSSLDIEVA